VLGRRSRLLRRVALLWDPRRQPEWEQGRFRTVGGRRFPTYLTGEDDLSIEVLCDYESAEWRWLRGIYSLLRAAVEDDGGRLALLVLPLAYQLEDGYPFRPVDAFARYCHEAGLVCVDSLEPLRRHRTEGVFPSRRGDRGDIWHPTVRGHAIIAQALDESLTAASLLPVTVRP
jgi:hypothetical protein